MSKQIRKIAYTMLAVLFWLLVWECLARKVNEVIFLPSPAQVFKEFVRLPKETSFYTILRGSVKRIGMGFFAGMLAGIVCTAVAALAEWLKALLAIPMRLMKTVPVASFVILLLLWVDPQKLTAVIAFFLVVPVFYENLTQGLSELDGKMKEAAKVYGWKFSERLRYLLLPGETPYFKAASASALGMCFKAGVAAEVIGHAKDSIGVQLYNAKLWLDTPLLFAWTLWLLIVSVAFAKAIMLLVYGAELLLFGRAGITGDGVAGNRTAKQGDAKKTGLKKGDTEENSSQPMIPRTGVPVGTMVASFSGVTKSYRKQMLVNHISAELHTGSLTILSGPSGCGKTTLLRLLLGITAPDEGSICRMSEEEWCAATGLPSGEMPRERAGVCFQEDRLCSWAPAWKNVQLGGCKLPKEEICRHLTLCGIADCVSQPVREFSGGMKRRVAVMRALLSSSPICILDEPFHGLDDRRKQYLMERIADRAEDAAVVIVTHNTSEIEYFQKNIENVHVIPFEAPMQKENK